MELLSNIKIDSNLKTRIDREELEPEDEALLALANALGKAFPAFNVHLAPMRQGIKLPALFVRFFQADCSARFEEEREMTFSFELLYLPEERASDGELINALLKMERSVHSLSGELFSCHDTSGSIVDRAAQVTGSISIWEQDLPDGPYIQKIKKEVRI